MATTIDRAMHIVLNGDLRLDPIGTGGRVRSQTQPGKIYTVGQYCECIDSNFRPDEDLCKHVLALRLHQRALTLQAQFAPQRELPEAPISFNIHLNIQGQPCQLTLRGFHCTEVLAEFERLMRQFQAEAPAASAPPQAALAVAAPTSPSAPPARVPPAAGAERPPLCLKHQRPRKLIKVRWRKFLLHEQGGRWLLSQGEGLDAIHPWTSFYLLLSMGGVYARASDEPSPYAAMK